ncbi:MAG TPA: response regulator [Gammaproteobacteria bacterium]|nr:response regulator [Gammaproteobacteria bacterium]
MKGRKILVADDDPATAKNVAAILSSAGFYEVEEISSISSFSELDGYQLIIMDIVWPENNRPAFEYSDYFGFSAMRYLRSYDPNTKIILMSKSLFDLDNLYIIQEADSFFKSTSPAPEILEKVSTVLSLSEQKAIKLASVLKLLVLEGRADIFGLDEESYESLVKEVSVLESESEKKVINKERWKVLLSSIEKIVPNVRNIVDLVISIKKIL